MEWGLLDKESSSICRHLAGTFVVQGWKKKINAYPTGSFLNSLAWMCRNNGSLSPSLLPFYPWQAIQLPLAIAWIVSHVCVLLILCLLLSRFSFVPFSPLICVSFKKVKSIFCCKKAWNCLNNEQIYIKVLVGSIRLPGYLCVEQCVLWVGHGVRVLWRSFPLTHTRQHCRDGSQAVLRGSLAVVRVGSWGVMWGHGWAPASSLWSAGFSTLAKRLWPKVGGVGTTLWRLASQ